MPVSLEKVPKTPAQVAGAVLDAIKANPTSFDMTWWVDLAAGEHLAPDDACGTTLCAAGWAARVTGWTLVRPWEATEVTDRWGDVSDEVTLYAEKDGERRDVGDVGAEVLGLKHGETFWVASEEEALRRLREIAGRG